MSTVTRRTIIAAMVFVFVFGLHVQRVWASTVPAPTAVLTNLKNPIVWQRFGSWLMITEDLPGKGRTCYYYDPVRRSKLLLKEPLKGEWQPLGSAIKWLMYIDNVNGLDRLMAHDVDYHVYSIPRPSTQKQVGCGMVDTRCIYGQYRAFPVGGLYPVDLFCIDMLGGGTTPFCISDSEKSQFAHDGNLLVYRARFGGGLPGIYGRYFNTPGEFLITPRDGVEPSVCGNLVAWAEPMGPAWRIVAMNLATGETRFVARTLANPPCPEAGQGAIFWQDRRNASKTGTDIYGYDWNTGKEFVVNAAVGDQYRLRVCGDYVTWISGATNFQTLWMVKVSR